MRDRRPEPPAARGEQGQLIMLVQATLDEVDPLGRVIPEQCTVTAKVVRSVEGQIVASTRITTAGQDDGPPAGRQAATQEAAQRLAERIIAQVRRCLDDTSPVAGDPATVEHGTVAE